MIVSVQGGKSFRLSIVPLRDITPHEKTIPTLLKIIKNDMKRTGFQRDPILTARNTHFALDGMHRIESLRSLGAKFALCAEYDYWDDSVRLERWLRTIVGASRKLISAFVSKFGMIPSPSFRAAVREVDRGRSGIALLSSKQSYVSVGVMNLTDLYQKVGETDVICERNKVELDFATESEKFRLFSSESVATLYPRRLSKDDVLRIVRDNELLPYKTTRYIVPLRPMGVYFPISYLRSCSLSECRKKLAEIVNFSKVRLERRNAWYEGRRYSEGIAIFRSIA